MVFASVDEEDPEWMYEMADANALDLIILLGGISAFSAPEIGTMLKSRRP